MKLSNYIKLLAVGALLVGFSGCTPFSGANTVLEIPVGEQMAKYKSPKEQRIEASYIDPTTGKEIKIKIESTQNGDMAAGAAAAAAAANQALAEAAGKLIDKVP